MGATRIDIRVANSESLDNAESFNVLIDSGAAISSLPSEALKRMGLTPYRNQQLSIFDGTPIRRDIGFAVLEYRGRQATVEVIFAETKDTCVLGTIALQSMGFSINPGLHMLEPIPILW